MERTIAVLAAPASGRGLAVARAEAAARSLRASGYRATVLVGSSPADAVAQAKGALDSGAGALVAAGGDGTVHLATQLLAETGIPLGIMPAGTGNDFARDLSIPDDPEGAIATMLTALEAKPRSVDLGRCGQRWFATVLASGFDSRVSERVNQMRWPRGKLRYTLSVLAELRVFRPIPYRIDIDGQRIDTEAMLVAVGNTTSYGAGMRITPGARCDDGRLQVVVIPPMSKTRLITSFPRIFAGTHVDEPEVRTFEGTKISLAAPGVSAYADGERIADLPVDCEVVPGALQVLAPETPAHHGTSG